MEIFNKLGASTYAKEFQKLSNLEIETRYKIESIRLVKTQFGDQVQVELEHCLVHLPKRFSAFKQKQLNILEGKYLIYGGPLGKSSVLKFAEWSASAVVRRPRLGHVEHLSQQKYTFSFDCSISDLVDRYNLLLQDNYDMYKKVCELKQILDFKDTIHAYYNLKIIWLK